MDQLINHLQLFNGKEQVRIVFKNKILNKRKILGDNYARILYYELQYNTSFQTKEWISVPIEQRRESFNEVKSQDGSIKLEPKTTSKQSIEYLAKNKKRDELIFLVFKTTHLPSNQNDLRVSLSCWANYTFRVIAYNRVGVSEPSPVSESMCTTGRCRPKTNPVDVKASATQSAPLLIEWEVRKKFSAFLFLNIFLFNILEYAFNKMGFTEVLV
jgi:hypothetical protein